MRSHPQGFGQLGQSQVPATSAATPHAHFWLLWHAVEEGLKLIDDNAVAINVDA
jgi:hypothetical protein